VGWHGGKILDAAGKGMPEIGRTDTPDCRTRRLVADCANENMC
jgi:hypothetical protein